MENRDPMNQPQDVQQEAAQETVQEAVQEHTPRHAEQPTIRAESIVQAKKVIGLIEEKLNGATRMPFRSDMGMVNVGELLNLFSQLRMVMPKELNEAVALLAQRQQLEQTSQQKARDLVNQASVRASETRKQAEADRDAMLADAQARAQDTEKQAHASAEKMLVAANQEAQRLISEHEITRRAQVYYNETIEKARAGAEEILKKAYMDVDGMYQSACTEVNKMLSGAAAALSRSGMELAGVRDQLLTGADASRANSADALNGVHDQLLGGMRSGEQSGL